MSYKRELFNTELTSNTLFPELVQLLLEPSLKKNWLYKVLNVLKELLCADSLSLVTFVDNQTVSSSMNTNSDNCFNEDIKKSVWIDEKYLVPLANEGLLTIEWDKIPNDDQLLAYNYIFNFLEVTLKNRAKLHFEEDNERCGKNILKIEELLSIEPDLKKKLNIASKEIGLVLGTSRCQVKIFSRDRCVLGEYDPLYSAEYVNGDFLSALSVITDVEKEWINRIKEEKNLFLQLNKLRPFSSISSSIENLLSIKSIFGSPLIFKDEIIGVLILHECSYEREWRAQELLYLRQVASLISLFIGNELENNINVKTLVDSNSGVITSEDFLRELSHVQIEMQVKKSCFSLIMVDIERLREINLNMGFVAGNLVLSQTARYLKRLYGEKHLIARYNNDEYVIIMKDIDEKKARVEAENLKEHLKNVTVLGIGPVDYNFSFVTFPTHGVSIVDLLGLLEQAMLISKSRGRSQVSGFDEAGGKSGKKWQELLTFAIPEIVLKKSSLKTGPEVIENIKEHLNKQKHFYNADILDSVQSLALALDAKDSYTEGHSKRVSEYAFMLAKYLELDLVEIEWIRLAASMHDIGKIGIPESILCKPGKLTKEEYDVMKKHSVIGARILKPIKPLENVTNLVLCHHEYWDGSGYPNGLSRTEIPIGSRIVSIVDAYQAMTSSRPYRTALPQEEAINRLRAGKEKQWDPELVDIFVKLVS